MKKILLVVAGVVLVAGIVWVVLNRSHSGVPGEAPSGPDAARPALIAEVQPEMSPEEETEGEPQDDNGADAASEPVPALTEEEVAADEEEKLVDAFDALTDKWMEPAKAGVTMTDIADFVQAFKAVPKARQDECLHRALNLVPDENVMLLAGILLDKSIDRDLVELVYNDILNRDENVKQPILQEIFKDKSHPCWADTAWILDVTGDKP